MESFRTGAKTVKIEVNDDGYCVELPVSNDLWIKRFIDFANDMLNYSKENEPKQGAEVEEQIAFIIALDERIKAQFGSLFGEGAYEEIFNQELVGPEFIIEFLDACLPYVEKRLDAREKAFKKYDPSKTGGAR